MPDHVNNAAGAKAQRAERDAQIWELSLDGHSERAIAEMFGITQPRVNQILDRAAKARVQRPAEQIIERELAKLNRWELAATAVLRGRHLLVRGDSIVREYQADPETGEPVTDDQGNIIYASEPLLDSGPILAAIDRLNKIAERRAKLLGLDAPTKAEVTTYDYTVNGVDTGKLA